MTHFKLKLAILACASFATATLSARDVAKTPENDPPVGLGDYSSREVNSTNTDLRSTNVAMAHDQVVEFQKGRAELTSTAQDALRSVIREAQSMGEINKVKVAVWSDKAFPRQGDLSKADRDLADRRGVHIKDFISKNFNISDVEIFNMAERSNWLARMFNTEDAELKSMFSKKEITPVTDDQLRLIRSKGQPRRAVILALHEMRR